MKIQASPLKSGDGNSGSCEKLVRYLEKENEGKLAEDKEYFFSHQDDYFSGSQVISAIDKNKRKLMLSDAKFYSLIFSPSEKELKIIGEGTDGLREYTRSVMDHYARNFNKGLEGDDLLYFGKVEFTRTAKGDEKRRKPDGKKYKSGEKLEGDNRHVHVIVSRKDITNKKKLSPMANARGNKSWKSVGEKAIVMGFDRDHFFQNCETTFDTIFEYEREREDSYLHKNILANGTSDEKKEEIRLVDGLIFEKNNEKTIETEVKKNPIARQNPSKREKIIMLNKNEKAEFSEKSKEKTDQLVDKKAAQSNEKRPEKSVEITKSSSKNKMKNKPNKKNGGTIEM